MTNNYETVLITIPDIPEDSLNAVKSKIENSIAKEKGEVIRFDDWGIKRLAYYIKHNKKGKYIYYNYKANPSVVSEIEKNLRLDERVIRFLTLKLEDEKTTSSETEKK